MKSGVENRLVAMFDILGFSNLVQRKGVDWLASRLDRLLTEAPEFNKPYWALHDCYSLHERVHFIFFSDTIVLFSMSTASELDFFLCCNQLMSDALELDLPLRGGIACGECYIDLDKNILVGEPIVDAYRLGRVQEWVGAALHPSCKKAWPLVNEPRAMTDDFTRCSIPVKKGTMPEVLPCAIHGWIGRGLAIPKLRILCEAAPKYARKKYQAALAFAEKVSDLEEWDKMHRAQYEPPYHYV